MLVDISFGELADRLTILEIKMERIPDSKKLDRVRAAVDILEPEYHKMINYAGLQAIELSTLMEQLREVNAWIWDSEDIIRTCAAAANFGTAFVNAAIGSFENNNRRTAIKRKIDDLLGSEIVEEKFYTTPQAALECLD